MTGGILEGSVTPRQCEIAAESYAASLLARAGYDVLVQYGANQPQYDLVAGKDQRLLPVSVKGSQDGGWMISVKYKEKDVTYHESIDRWLSVQRADLIYVFVQFMGVSFGEAPRAYCARPPEIAAHMKGQYDGRGHGVLHEDARGGAGRSKYDHKIPADWQLTAARLNGIWSVA